MRLALKATNKVASVQGSAYASTIRSTPSTTSYSAGAEGLLTYKGCNRPHSVPLASFTVVALKRTGVQCLLQRCDTSTDI